jgi:hypothetical protein
MSDDSYLQPISPVELTPAELAAIRARVADGVFLGGTYEQAYEQFLIAHRDRCALLARVDELQRGLPHTKGFAKRFRLERVGAGPGSAIFSCEHLLGESVEVVDAADFDAVVDDAARFSMRRHKDAERYRYLRRCIRVRKLDAPVGDISVHLNTDYVHLHPQYISAEGFEAEMKVLDKSIDAAIRKNK